MYKNLSLTHDNRKIFFLKVTRPIYLCHKYLSICCDFDRRMYCILREETQNVMKECTDEIKLWTKDAQ